MDICVFGDYKVRRICKYSYISDKIDDEYIFSDGRADETRTIDGGRLMDMIAKDMQDHKTIGIHFYPEKKDNSFKICIEGFNPNTGEESDTEYKIERNENGKIKL